MKYDTRKVYNEKGELGDNTFYKDAMERGMTTDQLDKYYTNMFNEGMNQTYRDMQAERMPGFAEQQMTEAATFNRQPLLADPMGTYSQNPVMAPASIASQQTPGFVQQQMANPAFNRQPSAPPVNAPSIFNDPQNSFAMQQRADSIRLANQQEAFNDPANDPQAREMLAEYEAKDAATPMSAGDKAALAGGLGQVAKIFSAAGKEEEPQMKAPGMMNPNAGFLNFLSGRQEQFQPRVTKVPTPSLLY